MTNAQIAATILAVYMIPGILVAFGTLNSKEFGKEFDSYSTLGLVFFVLRSAVFWPVIFVMAVGKALEMRRRSRK